jgi:hypothetical protein
MAFEYLAWNLDMQIIWHESAVDFNDYRVKAHLAALVHGTGSTTETIVNGFVLSDPQLLAGYRTVQEAWNRLDREQRLYVLAFRNMLSKRFLGDEENFAHLVYSEMVLNAFMEILERYEETNGVEWAEIPMNAQLRFAREAKTMIDEKISSEDNSLLWEIRKEHE